MASNSASSRLPDNPTVPQVVDFIWDRFNTVIHSHHRKEISLPAELKSIIGDHGIQVLIERFSQAIRQPIKTELVENPKSSTIRFSATEGPFISASATMGCYRISKAQAVKVPRPPNSFILFRQFNHPILKSEHPWMNNNQISCALGVVWKQGGAEFKEPWNARAKKLREIHKERYPEYHYNPRKSSDRKRRMTKAKAAHLQQLVAELQPVPDSAAGANANPTLTKPDVRLLPDFEDRGTYTEHPSTIADFPDFNFNFNDTDMYHNGQSSGTITNSVPFNDQYDTEMDFSNEPGPRFDAPNDFFDFDFAVTDVDPKATAQDPFSFLIGNGTLDDTEQVDIFGEQSGVVASNSFEDMSHFGPGADFPPTTSFNGNKWNELRLSDAADKRASWNIHDMSRMIHSDLHAGRENNRATGKPTQSSAFDTETDI